MPDRPDSTNDQALWERLSDAAGPPARGCPDLIALAAYVDRRVGDEETEAIEGHLADCPICLEIVTESCLAAGTDATALVPRRIVERAARLAGTGEPVGVRRPWVTMAGWGGRVAAGLAICAIGYRFGMLALPTPAPSEETILACMSFDVFSSETADTELEMLALAIEEASQ